MKSIKNKENMKGFKCLNKEVSKFGKVSMGKFD